MVIGRFKIQVECVIFRPKVESLRTQALKIHNKRRTKATNQDIKEGRIEDGAIAAQIGVCYKSS